MTMRWTDRWGPLTGVVGIALLVIGFLVAGSGPGTNDSDAKIASFYTSNSHQTRNIVAWLILLVVMIMLLSFVAAVRSRLTAAEGGVGRFAALAFAAGIVSVAALAMAISLFVAPAIASDDTSRFHLDPNTFRLINDFGYELWVISGVAGSLLAWSTMVVTFRTRVLPGWFGWLSAVVGVVALFTIFFIPVFVYWLWIVVLSILLVRAPTAPATPAAPPV